MSELTSVRIIVSDPWTIERPPHRGLKKIRILGLVQIRLQLWLINVGFYFVVFARIRKVGLFWNVCDFIENCFSVTWMDDWLCFGLGLEILDVVSGWSWKLWGLLLNGINEGFFSETFNGLEADFYLDAYNFSYLILLTSIYFFSTK